MTRRVAMVRSLALACALAAGPLAREARAQVRVPSRPGSGRPTTPPARPPVRAPGDTTVRDSAKVLVEWAETDSVMEALMARTGYQVTRYQGDAAVFDAQSRSLSLVGRRAAVGRDQTLVVGDTVIYNDSLKVVTALGDTVTLRDPGQGEDIVALGRIRYDIARQSGVVTNISTAITEGQRWILHGGVAAVVLDTSAAKQNAYYVRNGDITSCDDTIPHYHFRAKEIKALSGSVIVARPAILYIKDIPVMVLPFLFADVSRGRHSGILTPRFGFAELVRNSPGYRRRVDNFGYYADINHYLDASAWLNWLSNARPSVSDDPLNAGAPGYFDYNGEINYRWIDRFMQGSLAVSHLASADGRKTESVYWQHSQDFSIDKHLRMDLNYTTNTSTRRQTQTNYYAALATIRSSLSYQQSLGPLQLSLGGSRTQYSGLSTVQQTYPQLSIVPRGAISVGDWLTWTPSFSGNVSETLKNEQAQAVFFLRDVPAPGGFTRVDSSRVLPSERTVNATFNTPIRVFDFELQNAFSVNDVTQRGPQVRVAFNGPADTVGQQRTFSEFTSTELDWQTGFNLPRFGQGLFNITPSVSFANVGPGAFFVRSTLSGGDWVHQSKRPTFSLSAAPTVYGLFPGFGPFSRFRHSINPTLSFSYAPAANVSREYLQALGRGQSTSLVGIAQNVVSLGLSTNIEAKRRADTDTSSTVADAAKIRLIAVDFDGLSYNFQQLKERRRRAELAGTARPNAFVGLSSRTFGYTVRTELLPGFSLRNQYSLFTDDPSVVDTARFKPYREQTSLSFSVNRQTSFIAALARVFGARGNGDATQGQRATTGGPSDLQADSSTRRAASLPVAGSTARDAQFNVPSGRGFEASFSLSSIRTRPIAGVRELTADELCANVLAQGGQIAFNECRANPVGFPGAGPQLVPVGGIATFRQPPRTTLTSQMSFNITPKWAASWSTDYDFENNRFGGQIVNLQRELHDWRAVFGFSQSPTGSFAFTFFISLNAEPDLKFNYDRRSYPRTF